MAYVKCSGGGNKFPAYSFQDCVEVFKETKGNGSLKTVTIETAGIHICFMSSSMIVRAYTNTPTFTINGEDYLAKATYFDTGNISWGRDSQNASYRAIFLIVDLKVGDELSFRMYNSQSGFISGRSYYIGRWESK